MASSFVRLDALTHGTTTRSTLIIGGAKWKHVEVKGWPYGLSVKPSGAFLLSAANAPSIPGFMPTGMTFESPVQEGGGFNLEIQLDELVSVFGNDDILMVSSREAGVNRSITIRSIPGSQPALAKSFKLLPVDEVQRQSSTVQANPDETLGLAHSEAVEPVPVDEPLEERAAVVRGIDWRRVLLNPEFMDSMGNPKRASPKDTLLEFSKHRDTGKQKFPPPKRGYGMMSQGRK